MDNVHRLHYKQILAVIVGSAGLYCVSPGVNAEVTFDGSVGTAGTLNGSTMDITADRGQIAGNNLFHSFSVFNVDTDQTANFTGPANVQNIFGRVTGGNPSSIDGIISSSIPGANLFLMNPNGMMFGPNAQINISGSFHATTADYISFGNQQSFYADLSRNTTLSVATPSAFGFFNDPAGTITVNGSTIGVQEGNTISMIGGNIELRDGAFISAPDGQINIASAQSKGEFSTVLEQTDISQFVALGAINISGNMSGNSIIDASGSSGGKIVIRGGELVLDSSTIMSSSDMFSDPFNPSEIDVSLSETLKLDKDSTIATTSTEFSFADSGRITIEASNMEISDRSRISTSTDLQSFGTAGDISINASKVIIRGVENPIAVESDNFTGIETDSSIFDNTYGGNITINTESLELTSNATIYSNKLYGLGSSGNISIDANKVSLEDGSIIRSAGFLSSGNILINAAESFKLSGVSFGNDNTYYRISSITTTGGENAGNISIISKNLDINNGAKVTTRSLSNEDSGDISLSGEKIIISGINADLYNLLSTQVNTSEADKLLLSRTNISSISEADFGNSPVPNRIFKAGDINILADNFDLRDGASIISQSLGNQELTNLNNAGNISITSESLVISNGSIIDSSSVYGGNAGDITLDAESLSISGGTSNDLGLVTGVYSSSSSPVNTNTSSPIIKISADDISLTASAVIDSHTTGNAKGGEIEITSNNFNINNSKITSTSSSIGDAGSINIHANSINSENNSEITTHSEFANGGEINLISESKIQLTDSNLTSLVKGSKGSGGDISLKSNFIIINSSDIITTAVEGDGGNISINANNLILSSDSILDASSELALNGQILINTTNDLRKDMGKLPEERQNIENFAHGNCSAHNSRVSSLIATNESHHYNYSVVGPSNYDIKLANSYTRQAEINMTSETHQSLYDPYNQVIASNINCVRQ